MDAQASEPAPEAAATAPADKALPLAELDRALSPLRRTVAWAARSGNSPRFAESTLSPWLHRALALDLPDIFREQLVEMAGLLGGFEQLDAEAKHERLVALGVEVARLDATVGLPLPGGSVRRSRRSKRGSKGARGSKKGATEAAETPQGKTRESRRGNRRDRKRGRGRSRPEADHHDDPPQAREPASWSLSGEPRELADLVGAEVAARLQSAGIQHVQELVLQQPVDVEIVRPILGAGRPIEPGRRALGGRVRSRCTRLRPDGTARTEVVLHGAGPVTAVWDGVPQRTVDRLAVGARGVLVGRYEDGVLHEAEVARDDGKKAARLARYGVEGVSDVVVRDALAELAPELEKLRDPLPTRVLRRGGMPSLGDALAAIHYQSDSRPDARRRLAFDEALGLWLSRSMGRYTGSRRRGLSQAIAHGLVGRLEQILGLAPTDVQQLVLDEIKRDMVSQRPMLRLLTGDTGGGKGLVALLAAVHVAEAKGQVLFELPDPVSAEYRFLFAEPLFRELGLVARLIHGEPTSSQRDTIKRGEVHVVFGHNLLSAGLEFRRLGLVIGLEHGEPGATSTAVQQMKAPSPDTLVLTTSQAPAERLLEHYAEHDISVLEPTRRAAMRVQVLPASQRAAAYASAATALANNQQVMVIFPLVNGQDALDVRELARVKAALESDAFPGSRVGVFHGSMARDERYATYEGFRRHRFDVLVTTGPTEMGPPVPRAGVIIVEQADRMDPIRLHRACRHLSKSEVDSVETFFVTGDVPDAEGLVRAERVATRADELQLVRELSEASLPEAPASRFLDVRRDRELLLAAHQLVHASARVDPSLRRSVLRDALGDVELVWSLLHGGERLGLAESTGSSGKRRRRRRRRK